MTGRKHYFSADIIAVAQELQILQAQLLPQNKGYSIESGIQVCMSSNKGYIILDELINNLPLLIGRIDAVNSFENKRMVRHNKVTPALNSFINYLGRYIETG